MNTIDKYGDSHVIRAFITRNFAEIGYEFIDDVITYIKTYAFAGVKGLKTLSLPALTSIPVACFMGAEVSDTAEIPWEKLRSIGICAFANSSVIKDSSIVLSEATSINSAAFYNAVGISNVEADAWTTRSETTNTPMLLNKGVFEGSSIASISAALLEGDSFFIGTFKNCKNLISVNLPLYNGETKEMFSGCSAITKIELPKLTIISEDNTFNDCSALESVSLPAITEMSGDYTFNGCKALTRVSLPRVKGKIGNGTFRSCEKLTSINIPLVTELGIRCFAGTGVRTEAGINMPRVTKLSDDAFESSALRSFNSDSITEVGSGAFSYCNELTRISLAKTRVLEKDCFARCPVLKTVIIGGDINEVPEGAFTLCTELETFVLSGVTSVPLLYESAVAGADKIAKSASEGTPPVGIVYVPDALVDSFKATSVWSELNIQPLSSYNG